MADIVTSRIFTDGERGITAAKLNDIVGSSAIQPAFYTSKPTAGSADPADIALILKAGAYAQVPISALAGSVAQAQIWSTRLRSYNAIGNPNFEVDQRNAGTSVPVSSGSVFALDRWNTNLNGTGGVSTQQIAANVAVPGTNYFITSQILRTTVTTALPSLAVGDYLAFGHRVEGPSLRELLGDVHSVSILVRSSTANLKFGLILQDSTLSHGLAKLCTMGAANTWTLITLPALPLWTAGGTFPTNPGQIGYSISITLACGSSYIMSSNDVWVSTGDFGAVGQDNFLAGPVNSTFDIAFVQHEPGAVCSTLMDKPFSQNLDECLRYYSKSYGYSQVVGTADFNGANGSFTASATASANGYAPFPKRMAQTPTVLVYSPSSGAQSAAYDLGSGGDLSAGSQLINDAGFTRLGGGAAFSVGHVYGVHYTADAGW